MRWPLRHQPSAGVLLLLLLWPLATLSFELGDYVPSARRSQYSAVAAYALQGRMLSGGTTCRLTNFRPHPILFG